MITFITALKKFKRQYEVIQNSAIYSWVSNGIKILMPDNEVLLKEMCKSYPVQFLDNVKRGRELGFNNQSPIVKDLIAKALFHVNTPLVAFLNSDVIISEDFSVKIEKIVEKYGYDIFITGNRHEVIVDKAVCSKDTYKNVWGLKKILSDKSDIFISSKFFFRKISIDMPELIMGRLGTDDWFRWFGSNIPKHLNGTLTLPYIHCTHGHEHIKNQQDEASCKYNEGLWKGKNSISNWPLLEI